jgi:hypothetical protein
VPVNSTRPTILTFWADAQADAHSADTHNRRLNDFMVHHPKKDKNAL